MSDSAIKVSVVEDTVDLCNTVAMMVNGTPGLTCVSKHYNGAEACASIAHNTPDIVLIDLGLPGKPGVECIRELKSAAPGLQFLVWTVQDQDAEVFNALKAGASGYLLKTASPTEIIESIKELYDGGAPMSADVARKVVRYFQNGGVPQSPYQKLLTNREKEVLALLSKGKFYKEIAADLHVSIETVKSHCHNIYEKLHVSTRTEALNKYYNR